MLCELRWDEVIEYSFLSEFDLLCDACQDVRTRIWATHAGRLALDRFYKIQGAQHEIVRLNVEICRLITQMRDKELYLEHHIKRLSSRDPLLAHQISLHHLERLCSNNLHRQRLLCLSELNGFTGTLVPSIHIEPGPGWSIVNDEADNSTTSSICDVALPRSDVGNNATSDALHLDDIGNEDGDGDGDDDDDETDGIATAMAILSVLED